MKSVAVHFCCFTFSKILTLCCFILVTYFNKGLSHVGKRCWTPWCAKNAYCDMFAICRCRQDYPVVVTPEECRRGLRHGSNCQYTIECEYYDKNTACQEIEDSRRCACNPGLIYDERKKLCIKVEVDNTKEILSSTIIGISSFMVCGFLGCIVLKYCQQRYRGETDFRQFWLRIRRPTMNPPEGGVENTRRPSSDVVPFYEAARVSPLRELQGQMPPTAPEHKEENEDLPPSYEEVVTQAATQGKGQIVHII